MEKNLFLEKEIVEYYLQGFSAKKCSDVFNISQGVVYRYLKKNNVSRTKEQTRKITKESQKQICELYKSKLNAKQIANIFNVTSSSIFKILNKNKIKRKSKSEIHRKITVNDNYFENIDTEDKAYFLGLMISDGCNRTNIHTISIGLQIEDEEILKKFKNHLDYSGKLYYLTPKIEKSNSYFKEKGLNLIKAVKERCTLKITSKKLSEDLLKWGCLPAKSHSAYFPEIEEKYWNHFIRGIFDGDGWISLSVKYSTVHFGIMGNKLLIEKIQKILIEKCDLKNNRISHNKRDKLNTVSIHYGGVKNLLKIKEYLYKDAINYIDRKQNKFFGEFFESCVTKYLSNPCYHNRKNCEECGKEYFCKNLCQKCYNKKYNKEKSIKNARNKTK